MSILKEISLFVIVKDRKKLSGGLVEITEPSLNQKIVRAIVKKLNLSFKIILLNIILF